MRIVFCGGGTAGHVIPAIAVAEHIKKTEPVYDILFIGRDGGEENKITEQLGYKKMTLEISGIERKISIQNIKRIKKALTAEKKAKRILEDFMPDLVFATGGYVSWPVLRAADKLNIPRIIHESNATPGMTTKLLYKKCDKLLLNLMGSENNYKKKNHITVVGNPIRDEFDIITKKQARQRLGIRNDVFLISSFGGSGGSKRLNDVIIKLMRSYTSRKSNIKHIHSTGRKYFEKIRDANPTFTSKQSRAEIVPYVDNSPILMIASDVIIARCGAITLSEIAACNAGAILIPSPNVTGDHQTKNAKLFEAADAATVILEDELTERKLYDSIREYEYDNSLRERRIKNIRSFYNPQTKDIISEEIKKVINRKKPSF